MKYIIGKLNATWSLGAGLLVKEAIDFWQKEKLVTKIKRMVPTRKCHCGKTMPKHVSFSRMVHEDHNGDVYIDKNGDQYLWFRSYSVSHGWENLNLGCTKICTMNALKKPANHNVQVRPRYKMAVAGQMKYDLTIPWQNPDRGNL